MQFRVSVVAIVTLSLILKTTNGRRTKTSFKTAANEDVFHLLLGLYKINPLKSSKVYNTFTKHMFNDKKTSDSWKYHSPEAEEDSEVTLRKLDDIETLIHRKQTLPEPDSNEMPKYDINDIDTEKFDSIILTDGKTKLTSGHEFKKESKRDFFYRKIASRTHDYQKSFTNQVPYTRLYPINGKKNYNTQLFVVTRKPNYVRSFDHVITHPSNRIDDLPIAQNDNMDTNVIIF